MTTKGEVYREQLEQELRERPPAALRRIKAIVEYYFISSPLELLTTDLDLLDALIADADTEARR